MSNIEVYGAREHNLKNIDAYFLLLFFLLIYMLHILLLLYVLHLQQILLHLF